MKEKDVIFSRKEFLNLDGMHSMANIVAQIVRTSGDEDKGRRNLDIHLGFADCDRKVTIWFDYWTEYERKNALHKVDTLIDVLTDFKDALEREMKYQKRLEKRRKRLEEESKD